MSGDPKYTVYQDTGQWIPFLNLVLDQAGRDRDGSWPVSCPLAGTAVGVVAQPMIGGNVVDAQFALDCFNAVERRYRWLEVAVRDVLAVRQGGDGSELDDALGRLARTLDACAELQPGDPVEGRANERADETGASEGCYVCASGR